MLVLGRRTGESIQIGDDITVTICKVNHNQVSVGINAPPSVRISRPVKKQELSRAEHSDTDRPE